MKTNLFVLFLTIAALSGCSSARKAGSSTPGQGINGRITRISGNQMPMVGVKPSATAGLKTTVFIYEPTNIAQVTRQGMEPLYTAIGTKKVIAVDTDSTGAFRVSLPAGSYSVFVKLGNHYYANSFDQYNNIALFTVETGKMTEVNLTVSLGATF